MNRMRQLREDFAAGRMAKDVYIRSMHEIHSALFDYSERLAETEISAIDIRDNCVIMTARETGIRFMCDPRDHRIAPIEILNFSKYEPDETAMMRSLVGTIESREIRYFDIGANIGWYALNLAAAIPNLHVTAFEPVPPTFAQFRRNVELNSHVEGLKGRIELNPFGLSSEPGQFTVYFYGEGSGNASLRNLSERAVVGSVEGVQAAVQPIECKMDVLDSFVERTGRAPDFVKCDVEGAELLVFRGGQRTLGAHKPIVFTEMLRKWSAKFGYHPNEIISLFHSLGYVCFSVNGRRLRPLETMTDATVETNFFFLHSERHSNQIRDFRS